MKTILKQSVCLFLVSSLMVMTGCAGRTARNIDVTKPGDTEMNCAELRAEIHRVEARIKRLVEEQTNRKWKNIAWGTVGVVAFWPALFMMDLSPAAEKELRSLRERRDYLQELSARKDCEVESTLKRSGDKTKKDTKKQKQKEKEKKGTDFSKEK